MMLCWCYCIHLHDAFIFHSTRLWSVFSWNKKEKYLWLKSWGKYVTDGRYSTLLTSLWFGTFILEKIYCLVRITLTGVFKLASFCTMTFCTINCSPPYLVSQCKNTITFSDLVKSKLLFYCLIASQPQYIPGWTVWIGSKCVFKVVNNWNIFSTIGNKTI